MMITNLFQSPFQQAVLMNYTTQPFLQRHTGHTNVQESHLIAQTFHALGYRVDVVDFCDETPLDLSPYQLLFGFGQAFERSFTQRRDLTRVYYATGAHVSHQNPAEIARVRDVNRRHGTRLLPQRIVPWCWSMSTAMSDALVVIGNDWTVSTYRPFTDAPIHMLAATALFNPQSDRIARTHGRRPSGLLWFGASGFVHKGLDVCLEYAAMDPEVTLHVCAAEEPEFMQAFSRAFALPNVVYHGFVNVQSDTFIRIVSQCECCILPSCSEGQSTSLLTAMATGLLPIATRFTGVDVGSLGILLDEISVDALARAVAAVRAMLPQERARRDLEIRDYCHTVHAPRRFAENFRALIAGYVV